MPPTLLDGLIERSIPDIRSILMEHGRWVFLFLLHQNRGGVQTRWRAHHRSDVSVSPPSRWRAANPGNVLDRLLLSWREALGRHQVELLTSPLCHCLRFRWVQACLLAIGLYLVVSSCVLLGALGSYGVASAGSLAVTLRTSKSSGSAVCTHAAPSTLELLRDGCVVATTTNLTLDCLPSGGSLAGSSALGPLDAAGVVRFDGLRLRANLTPAAVGPFRLAILTTAVAGDVAAAASAAQQGGAGGWTLLPIRFRKVAQGIRALDGGDLWVRADAASAQHQVRPPLRGSRLASSWLAWCTLGAPGV